MSINSRIKERRESLEISRQTLAEMVGVTVSAIANYENEFSIPRADTLYKLMKALKCDANYLYQDDMNLSFMLSTREMQMIEKYRSLDDYGRSLVDVILDKAFERCQPKAYETLSDEPNETNPMVLKPSFIFGLSAGTGEYVFGDVPCEQIEVPKEYEDIDFVIGVSGDSMEPTYHDQDLVMIKKQPEIAVGEIGAFMIDGTAYIKELGENCLISHNKKYRPIVFSEEMRVDCIGKVVGKL